jgi:hypothetical protein
MSKSKFYWECLGQTYPFDSDKTYLIYFKGCFCPPTAGHFNTLKQFTDKGSNIYGMVHQIGSERRHGVPYYLNRKIWKTYIDELLPSERIYLTRYSSMYDILDLPIIDSIDTVIYIRGNEDHDIKYTEKNNLKNFKGIINKLNERGINMDFCYLDRPLAHKLSASKFIKNLIRTKKKCKRPGCDCKYRKLKYYMPSKLNPNVAMSLVEKLQQHYLI